MAVFHIYANVKGESYWLKAATDEEARRLVVLNAPDAADVARPDVFKCELESDKSPPWGVILRQTGRPIKIEKR